MSDHEELESSIAAWVLGALDAEEAASVRVHAEGCASCTEVAARLRRVVGALPLVAEEVEPPARLRERVLAAAGAPSPAGPPAAVRVVRPKRPEKRRAPAIPAYAVAAIVLIALIAGALLDRALVSPAIAPAPAVARYTLSGHQQMSGAQATVVDLKSDGVTLIDFRGLPPLAPGRVYEVWLIRSGANPQPAAVFVPDSNGAKVVLVGRSLAGYTTMAVTDEPGPDGSTAPTQPPQLYGTVA